MGYCRPRLSKYAGDFPNCEIENLPFKYVGLPVEANSRLKSTWNPLVNLLTRRLHSWKHKYVSLGGRMVLLNYVLNDIPIFFLSFLKMSVKVWKNLVRLQRSLLGEA